MRKSRFTETQIFGMIEEQVAEVDSGNDAVTKTCHGMNTAATQFAALKPFFRPERVCRDESAKT